MKLQNKNYFSYSQINANNSKKDNVVKLNFGINQSQTQQNCFGLVTAAPQIDPRVLERQEYQRRIDEISRSWEKKIQPVYGAEAYPHAERIVTQTVHRLGQADIQASLDPRFPASAQRILRAAQDYENHGFGNYLPNAVYNHPKPFLQAELDNNSTYFTDGLKRFEGNFSGVGLTDPELCIVYVDPTPEQSKKEDVNIACGWSTAPQEWHEIAHVVDAKVNGLQKFQEIADRPHQTQEEINAAYEVSLYAMKAYDTEGKEIPNNGAELKADYLAGKVYSGLEYGEAADNYYKALGGPKLNRGLNW